MIEDVLAELESVGTVESEGEFTMDRSKAREKMRRFALADPRSYVLELVQAASLKGATRVRFDIDSRDMRMEFDGRPFTADDFDDIYGAAFTRMLNHDVLARRQLALGVNSAMALRPQRITVVSGDGTAGARLTLEPEHDDSFETIETDTTGTVIHVRERFRVGTFVAMIKNLRGTLAEEQLLRARCPFASFEIDLEGQRLDRGLSIHKSGMVGLVEARLGHTKVVAGLHEGREDAAWLDIIKDGVWITNHRLPSSAYPKGFFAVVQDHGLRKDVSQSDIVRDSAYDSMLGVVAEAAELALVDLAKRSLEDKAPPWAEEELVHQMLRLAHSGALLPGPDGNPTALADQLRRIPLWETTTEHWVCLDELIEAAKNSGSIVYTTAGRFTGVEVPGHSFVLYMRIGRGHIRESLQVLDTVFDGRLREITPLLRQKVANEKARKVWRSRPAEPTLLPGNYLVRQTFEGPRFRGEVGLVANATEKTRIGFVVDGCWLCEEEPELPLLGLRVVIASDDFEPAGTFTRITPKAKALAAVLQVIKQLTPLYGSLPTPASSDHWVRACAMSFLETALRGDDLAALLTEGLGFPKSALDAVRARADAPPLKLSMDLGTVSPHPVATMPLFRMLSLAHVSLQDLSERARQGQTLYAVDRAVSQIDVDILVLNDEQREAIAHLFPGGIQDGWPQVERMRKRVEFMRRPKRSTEMRPEPPGVVVSIEGDGITGRLSVVPRAGHLTRRRDIQLLHQQRPIDSVQVLTVGHCIGWVESTHLVPKPDYSGLEVSNALDDVRAAILRAFAQAAVLIAQQALHEMTDDRRVFLIEVAGLMFPSHPFRVVFDQLSKSKELLPPKRAKIYRWLYGGLQAHENQTEFEQRLWRLTRSKTPIGDAISVPVPKGAIRWALAAVDVLFPPGDDPQAIDDRSLTPVEPLGALPLFRRHDGTWVTIDKIREHLSTGQAVLYIEQPKSIDLGSRMVLVLNDVERQQLRRITGASNILNGTALVEREQNRQAMQAQPKAARIALSAGQAIAVARVDVDANGHRTYGEVGLVLEHPQSHHRKPLMLLTAHCERRPFEPDEVLDRPCELVAVINDDAFSPTFDHTKVRRDKVFSRVLERCHEAIPLLIGQLIERWSTLPPQSRASAWCHILDFLMHHAPPTAKGWTFSNSLPKMVELAAQVPGFQAVGRTMVSVAQLAEVFVQRGKIEIMPPPADGWGDSPFGPERPIVAPGTYERHALTTLFDEVQSVEDKWPLWQQRASRMNAARPLRLPDTGQSLVTVDLPGPMVEGRLAIPIERFPMDLDLCSDGKVVIQRTIEGVLPCQGAIFGKGVIASESWNDVHLDGNAQAVVRHASIDLYRALGQWFRKHLTNPQRSRAASLLRAMLLRLRDMERKSSLDRAHQALYDDLRPLPVLALRNGRHISLMTALEEQPDELTHLGLWDSNAHRLLQMFDERDAMEALELDPNPDLKPNLIQTTQAQTPPPPPPPPKRAPPTPAEQLLLDVRAELNLVRDRNRELLTHVNLARVVIEPLPRRHRSLVAYADDTMVAINRDHPVVQRAIAEPHDPVWRSYVASALYTALNVWLEEVTDADEMHFLGLMGHLIAEA